MTAGFKRRYTFRLSIDRNEDTILDIVIGANDTPDELTKAKKTIQRMLNEYTPTAKAAEPVPPVNPEVITPLSLLKPGVRNAADQQQGGQAKSDVPPTTAPSTTRKPDGAKGLLRLSCQKCGNVFGTFLREYQTEVACKCGHQINLTGQLGVYHFTCPYCQHEGFGKTNSEDPEITVRCKCGKDVDLRWEPDAKEYRS